MAIQSRLAGFTVMYVRTLILVLYPLILLSELVTRLVARGKSIHVFSRDEFIAMAGIGERSGDIKQSESRIIRNLFRLEMLKAKDIMTPRTVLSAMPKDMTVDAAVDIVGGKPFSRLPIYGVNKDDIHGFVLKDEILLHKAKGEGGVQLESLKRNIMTVSESLSLSGLLETLLDHRHHLAMVADVYGGTLGIVTLEDVVEALLGLEIVDEMDRVADMQALAREQWKKRAKALGLQVEMEEDGQEKGETPPRE